MQARAEALGQGLPPLLVAAERLAFAVAPGAHGRRRAGPGAAFWQYRRAETGDSAAAIDWRRSARSDHLFVRQTEWEAAETVPLWVDRSQAMAYGSADETKHARAALLALALAVLLVRGGERVTLPGSGLARAIAGRGRLPALAAELDQPDPAPYGTPPQDPLPRGARAVFFSDFLGPRAAMEARIGAAADRGVRGILVEILDPAEIAFPFKGRLLFRSIDGGTRHETQRADSLRPRYLERLAERRAATEAMARQAGWLLLRHPLDTPPRAALLWLWAALGERVW